MKPYELFQLAHLAQLLKDVTAIIYRYQRETVPEILENRRHHDRHLQLPLPFGDPEEWSEPRTEDS